jgi:hypothetical protein
MDTRQKGDAQRARRLMKVYVKPGSKAERKHRPSIEEHPRDEQLAPGFQPTPQHDLKFRGGRTIAHLSFINFYVGGAASWSQSDVDAIDGALSKAMADPTLNNVIRQYFANQEITTKFLGSHFTGTKRPKRVNQTSAERLVAALATSGNLSGIDFNTTVVNLLLPSGTVLTDGTGGGREADGDHDHGHEAHPAGLPEDEESSSLEGLGGYHGSVAMNNGTKIYYAVGVFSQRLPGGRENGIAVFDAPWKNVVATFYHELNEARTDPDVDDAISSGKIEGIIGWNSDAGEECGDFPVAEAGQQGDLSLVFQEVHLAAGGNVPVQFQYSNAVHGPEGPIASAHQSLIAHDI